MFFVGFGGQLITILLTVAIPFVLLFSGTSKEFTVNQSSQVTKVELKVSRQIEVVNNTPVILNAQHSDLQKIKSLFFLLSGELITDDSFCNPLYLFIGASGNKAPPSL
jgi:hypothetical protein